MNLSEIIKSEYNKSISECTNEEIYNALLTLVKTMAEGKQHKNSKKKLYYISAEFLIGKLLSNNLINLGIYDDIKEELAKNGKDLCEIEEFEKEPSLGNGGLGRLAACFLDSIATLGLNGGGVGLNYHFGLFRQVFKNNAQTTIPDQWLTEKSWLTKTDVTYTVKFRDMMHLYSVFLTALMYLCPIIYTMSFLPERVQKIVMLNPLTHFLIIFRECVLYEENISIKILEVGVLETFIMLGIGIYVFGKRQDKFIMDI